MARIGIELKNAAQALMGGADSETLTKAIQEKEQRKRYLEFQIRQIRTTSEEKVFVTPSAIRQKFQRLLDVVQKKPKEAAEALKKVFPEGGLVPENWSD